MRLPLAAVGPAVGVITAFWALSSTCRNLLQHVSMHTRHVCNLDLAKRTTFVSSLLKRSAQSPLQKSSSTPEELIKARRTWSTVSASSGAAATSHGKNRSARSAGTRLPSQSSSLAQRTASAAGS